MAPFAPGRTSSRTHYLMAAQVEEHRRAEGRHKRHQDVFAKLKAPRLTSFSLNLVINSNRKAAELWELTENRAWLVSKCCVSLIHLEFKFDRY